MSRGARKCPLSYVSAAVAVVRLGNAPRKKEKASRSEVSYRCKVKECTPEEGKSKSPSGELLLQSQGMHPRKEEKASHSEVSCRYEIRKVTPESGKASCSEVSCRYKIREITLEEGESKLFRGVRPIPQGNAPSHKEAPPRPRLGGRTLPAIELLTDVSKAGSCGRSSLT